MIEKPTGTENATMRIQIVARDIEPADSTDYRNIVRLIATHAEWKTPMTVTPQEAAEKLATLAWSSAYTRAPGGAETEVVRVDGRYVRSVANDTTEDNLISLPTFKEFAAEAAHQAFHKP